MNYYEVKSKVVELFGADSFVSSEQKLSEFDLLVIDTEKYGFITCTVAEKISQFDAISMPFEIRTYLMKMDVQPYLKKKKAEKNGDIILKKVETKVKEIQYLEKLRKYQNDPSVKALLQEYDSLHSSDERNEESEVI